MKKHLARFLAFVLLFALCTVTVSAQEVEGEPAAADFAEKAAGDIIVPEEEPTKGDISSLPEDTGSTEKEETVAVPSEGFGSTFEASGKSGDLSVNVEAEVSVNGGAAEAGLSAKAVAGDQVTFRITKVVADGQEQDLATLGYKWYKNGDPSAVVSGANGSEYTFTCADEMGYMCSIIGTDGNGLVSRMFMITSPSTDPGDGLLINWEALVDGQRVLVPPEGLAAAQGSAIELRITSVRDSSDPTYEPEDGEVAYEWYFVSVGADGGETKTQLPGQDKPLYKFNYDGTRNRYVCKITFNGQTSEIYFPIRKIGLRILEVKAEPTAAVLADGQNHYNVNDVPQGAKGTLRVTATSADGEVSYRWIHGVRNFGTDHPSETLSVTTGVCPFTKTEAGTETYTCIVTEKVNGAVTTEQSVQFWIWPEHTLKVTAQFNGMTPKKPGFTFSEGAGYGVAAKADDTVVLKANVVSSDGSGIKYTWRKNQNEDEIAGTGDTLVVKGVSASGDQYDCWVEDGTDVVCVQFYLFRLDSGQVTAEVERKAGMPVISLGNGNLEDLTNRILQDYMESISGREGRDKASVKIKLEAEAKDSVTEAESAAISGVLSEGDTVGAYLDINLYAEIEGQKNKIEETGVGFNLTVELPRNMAGATGRTYQVVRMHDGKAEVLDCLFNKENGTITFETDKFSVYALIYKDVKENGGPASGTGTGTGTKKGTGTVYGVKTGDNANTILWSLMLLVSGSVAVGVLVYGKRRGKRWIC